MFGIIFYYLNLFTSVDDKTKWCALFCQTTTAESTRWVSTWIFTIWEPLLGNHASQIKANVLKAGAQIRTLFLLGTLAVGGKFGNTGSTGALGIVSNKACINVLADGLIMHVCREDKEEQHNMRVSKWDVEVEANKVVDVWTALTVVARDSQVASSVTRSSITLATQV